MKQNQKILLAIGLGVVILLNVLILGWLLADFFSGPNGEGIVVATDSGEETMVEETTGEETTEDEETSSEEETKADPVEQIVGELSFNDAKRVIHTFSWGSGEGQLGVYGAWNDYLYPRAFAVEDGAIFVLDEANQRILICENEIYSEIKVEGMPEDGKIKYQNGWIAVWGKERDKYFTMIFKRDRDVKMTIEIPEDVVKYGTVADVLEIGETEIVWKVVKEGNRRAYRYNWTTGELKGETLEYQEYEIVYKPGLIGGYEDNAYYCYAEDDSGVKLFNRENKEYRIYTKVDDARYDYILPKATEYLSADGHLYLMEGFIDRVEISELVFDAEKAVIVEETEPIEPTTDESTGEEPESTENPSQVEWIKREIPLSEAKSIMYTLPWGAGQGQFGRIESESLTRDIEVENGVVYLLDSVNQRVKVFEGDLYSEIDISRVTSPYDMKCKNGLIAIFDRANGAVAVFRKDGNLETEFKTEQYHLFGYLISVLELGDTYIEWNLKLNIGSSVSGYRRLRYDWVENRAQITGKLEEHSNDDVPKDEDYSIVIGRHDGDVYYYPAIMGERQYAYKLTRQTGEYRLYTTIDTSSHYYFQPLWYLSADGHFYVVEYMQDRVEISEIKLEPVDS